jgi:hypothetical protein
VVRAHVDEGLLDVHAHAEMPWWLHAVPPAATTATTGTAHNQTLSQKSPKSRHSQLRCAVSCCEAWGTVEHSFQVQQTAPDLSSTTTTATDSSATVQVRSYFLTAARGDSCSLEHCCAGRGPLSQLRSLAVSAHIACLS